MAFKERFKDKVSLVGRSGEHALLAPASPKGKVPFRSEESVAIRELQTKSCHAKEPTKKTLNPLSKPSAITDAGSTPQSQQIPSSGYSSCGSGVVELHPELLPRKLPCDVDKRKKPSSKTVSSSLETVVSDLASPANFSVPHAQVKTSALMNITAPVHLATSGPSSTSGYIPMGLSMPLAGHESSTNIGTYDYSIEKREAKRIVEHPAIETKGAPPRHGRRSSKHMTHVVENGVCDDNTPKRQITYRPYTLAEYRKVMEEASKPRGGLGPSDTDQQREAARRRERLLEYGIEMSKINRTVIATNSADEGALEPKPIVQPIPEDLVEKHRRRERALVYAKGVPKPRQKSDESPKRLCEITPVKEEIHSANEFGGDGENGREREERLADLEAKHKRDQYLVGNIKKSLNL
jgi:hypothetical protein